MGRRQLRYGISGWGDVVAVGMRFLIIDCPGRGHVMYHLRENQGRYFQACSFSGGVGRFFEGSAEVVKGMRRIGFQGRRMYIAAMSTQPKIFDLRGLNATKVVERSAWADAQRAIRATIFICIGRAVDKPIRARVRESWASACVLSWTFKDEKLKKSFPLSLRNRTSWARFAR